MASGLATPQIRLDDLNQVIKLFSYCIQDRIDELDGVKTTAVFRRSPIDDCEAQILERYADYKIENLKEIKYAQKFCQRILEIFSYFKSKSKTSQQQLSSVQDKILTEMDGILSRHPIALGTLLSFVVEVVKKPFFAERRKIKASQVIILANIQKEPTIRNRPPLTQYRPKIQSSTSQSNILKSDIRKSLSNVQNKKFKPNDVEMARLFCELNLDRGYMTRCNNQLVLLQKDAADRIFRDMYKRNQKILQEMTMYLKRCQQRQEQMKTIQEVPNDTKILQDAKKNINLETPIKNVNSAANKQKTLTLSNKYRRSNCEPQFNNWLPRRQPEDSITMDINYNFCIKQSYKVHHRKLRRQQENDTTDFTQNCQNKSMQEVYDHKFQKSQNDDFVKLLA